MRISSSYEHSLQSVYWDIGIRGIRIDTKELAIASQNVDAEIKRNLAIASNQWGCTVFIGRENAPEEEDEEQEESEDASESEEEVKTRGVSSGGACNINATQGNFALLKKLKDLGYNVPKITKKNEEGDYEQSFSAGELAIQKMLAENQFGYAGGDPALRAILKVRELGKLKSSYLNARLVRRGEDSFFICIYNVAGTLSGRRSSKRHPFNFGANGQNFPKHSKTANLFRKCLVPRVGNIFLFVDQIQAEDWPVSALAQNGKALLDLAAGVDRHSALASLIFGHLVPPKGSPEWDEVLFDQERYIGKKARHANNYDMRPPRFSDVLAQEASLSVSIPICKQILDAVNNADPSIKGVFHKYVQDELSKTRILITPEPFYRERQFLSLRPGDNNSNTLKEAYAFIPQSTVADNTGYAVLSLEMDYGPEARCIVQEGHDSITQDVEDSELVIYNALVRTQNAFDRKIRFTNGVEIRIPTEAELGYSFAETVKIKEFSLKGVREAREKLRDKVKKASDEQSYSGLLA